MSTIDNENRREGFRMDDILKLHVTVVDPNDPDGIVADFDNYRMRACFQSHLRNETRSRFPKLQGIRKRDADVADYLEHLETQIVQLAARLSDKSEEEFEETHQETKVNMSASGLRWYTSMNVSEGQQLEVSMQLSTSGVQLVAVADVIRVETAEEHSSGTGADATSLVSIRYSQIHIDDAEAIIRHLSKLQMIELQARRKS